MDWDGSNKGIAEWEEKLRLADDWNSMSTAERKTLIRDLKDAVLYLGDVEVSQKFLLGLVKLFDHVTVFEALLSLVSAREMSAKSMNKYQAKAYLSKAVRGIWRDQHPLSRPSWQRKPEQEEVKVPASSTTIEEWNPYKFSRPRCKKCNKPIRRDNTTGLCYKCQK